MLASLFAYIRSLQKALSIATIDPALQQHRPRLHPGKTQRGMRDFDRPPLAQTAPKAGTDLGNSWDSSYFSSLIESGCSLSDLFAGWMIVASMVLTQ